MERSDMASSSSGPDFLGHPGRLAVNRGGDDDTHSQGDEAEELRDGGVLVLDQLFPKIAGSQFVDYPEAEEKREQSGDGKRHAEDQGFGDSSEGIHGIICEYSRAYAARRTCRCQ